MSSAQNAHHETTDIGPAVASFTPTRTKSGTTDLPEGIVRVFREAAPRASEEPRSPSAQSEPSEPPLASREILLEGADVDGVTLGVLAVPAWMTASDFLTFVAPAQEGMAHLRMIRCVGAYVVSLLLLMMHTEIRRRIDLWYSLTFVPRRLRGSLRKNIMGARSIPLRCAHHIPCRL